MVFQRNVDDGFGIDEEDKQELRSGIIQVITSTSSSITNTVEVNVRVLIRIRASLYTHNVQKPIRSKPSNEPQSVSRVEG